jgi:hypothetical protein
MNSGRVGEERKRSLVDSTEALEKGRVDESQFVGHEVNHAPNHVADNFGTAVVASLVMPEAILG